MPDATSFRLPVYATAFLLGGFVLLSMPSLDAAFYLLLLFPAIILLLLVLMKCRLPVFIFMAGFAWTGLLTSHQLAMTLPQALAGQNMIVDGHIDGLPERDGRVVRFNLIVFRSDLVDGKQVKGRIRVSDYRLNSIDPQPGEAWRLLLRVKSPHGFSNPAGFDYEKWLFSQRIIATAYIRDIEQTSTAGADVNVRIPISDRSANIDRLRLSLAAQVNRSLPESSLSGIITALATGDRRSISPGQWSVLQKTGTSHLMAISGLHVGMVAGIAFFLFRYFWSCVPGLPAIYPAHKAAALAALLFAIFYSLMAGFSVPTQRALVMLTILTISLVIDRRVQGLNILSLTLITVLIFEPLSILSAGFWLSFSAVGMILFTLLFRRQKVSWIENGATKAIRLQWKLSLMMAPVTFLFFQQIPLTGPLANVIAIPVVAFLIVPLVLTASLSYLAFGSGVVEQNLYLLAEYLLQLLWSLLEALAIRAESVSFSPGHSTIALAGLLFACLILSLPAGLKLRRLALSGLLVFFLPSQNQMQEGEFKLILLDVGQGLSAIILTAKHSLLFDTGARFSSHFNAGDAVVLPVMKMLSVNTLDTLIISHSDNDHSGAAESILQGIKVQQVISNENISADVSSATSPDASFDTTACIAGLQWQWEGVSFRILHPDGKGTAPGNNASCVLRVESQYGSLLLPADIEKESELEIIRRYPAALKSSILVAPHHGSKTSSSESFIDAVAPELVLFPAGWMNRYHHPAETVTKRLADREIASRMTGECGSISVMVEPSGLTIESWRHTNKNIWDSTETDRRCRKVAIGLPEIPAL